MAKILIVEDDLATQRMLTLTLHNSGHEIIIANHGGEALETLSHESVDLALVDVAMPEMDGLTLLQTLRQDTRYDSLPVIMLTASGQDQDRITALALGVQGFLIKPTSSGELLAIINGCI